MIDLFVLGLDFLKEEDPKKDIGLDRVINVSNDNIEIKTVDNDDKKESETDSEKMKIR